MANMYEIAEYSNRLLAVDRFHDYCPNGLQIEGRQEVRKIAAGVTACQAFIDKAIAAHADLLLVHHGFFWKGEPAPITGIKRRRIQALLGRDVNLLAYHLPLDAHPDYGNNAQLGHLLGFEIEGGFGTGPGPDIGMRGRLNVPLDGEQLKKRISESLGREPLYVAGTTNPIQSVAWCSGGAQGYIDAAIALGVDAFITGEASEQTFHIARESGIHFFAAGHHATERYGVQALAVHLADKFALDYEYIDIENPI